MRGEKDPMYVFLLGVPKSGSTWLSSVLDQHPDISISNPKEPNIVGSHKGTFLREYQDPDWDSHTSLFDDKQVKIDASVHTFACPLAPQRIYDRYPDARFILSFREPVARSVSHWNMVRTTREAKKFGRDWTTFEKAWNDESLHADSYYGESMKRWLQWFDLDQFILLDSKDMKTNPKESLGKIEQFLKLPKFEYDISKNKNANAAATRRPITSFGKTVSIFFSLFPDSIKSPFVSILRKNGFNIYKLPIMSRKGFTDAPTAEHYLTCGQTLLEDIVLFGEITNFNVENWLEVFKSKLD